MTKKDYIKLANTLKLSNYVLEPNTNIEAYSMFRQICDNMCEMLKADNYNFDRDKFLTSVGFDN